MKNNFFPLLIITLIASLLPTIIVKEWFGGIPYLVPFTQIVILTGASIYLGFIKKRRHLSQYTFILTAIVALQVFAAIIQGMPWWRDIFDVNTFMGNFGGSILIKFIFAIPVIALLLFFYKSPEEAYLVKGDLSIKAERIGWLGIEENKISWGRLSVISALLISLGTLLLTLFTVTGLSVPDNLRELPGHFPLIVLFALVNSFSEGIVYRSAIMGPLRKVLSKDHVILIAAVFFGLAHYYGAPSGIVGVAMSGLLGWYLCRSMYETKGFVSAWIIHFMQDVVIFSTIIIMG